MDCVNSSVVSPELFPSTSIFSFQSPKYYVNSELTIFFVSNQKFIWMLLPKFKLSPVTVNNDINVQRCHFYGPFFVSFSVCGYSV